MLSTPGVLVCWKLQHKLRGSVPSQGSRAERLLSLQQLPTDSASGTHATKSLRTHQVRQSNSSLQSNSLNPSPHRLMLSCVEATDGRRLGLGADLCEDRQPGCGMRHVGHVQPESGRLERKGTGKTWLRSASTCWKVCLVTLV